MKIPHFSPPVQRTTIGSAARQVAPMQAEARASSALKLEADFGVVPSAFEDCYSLRGLARNLCLTNY